MYTVKEPDIAHPVISRIRHIRLREICRSTTEAITNVFTDSIEVSTK